MRRRALEIVSSLARQNSDELFLDFCLHHGEDLDLESALGLLAQTQYPDINHTAYQAVLDLWASELFEEVEQSPEPEQKLSLLNHYLFKKLQFTGQQHGYQDPESCYLNRVMDKRSGSAITLSVIYILLGRRLQLPLAWRRFTGSFRLPLPGSHPRNLCGRFSGGKFWTKVECIRQLLTSHHGVHDGYLTPLVPVGYCSGCARRCTRRMPSWTWWRRLPEYNDTCWHWQNNDSRLNSFSPSLSVNFAWFLPRQGMYRIGPFKPLHCFMKNLLPNKQRILAAKFEVTPEPDGFKGLWGAVASICFDNGVAQNIFATVPCCGIPELATITVGAKDDYLIEQLVDLGYVTLTK